MRILIVLLAVGSLGGCTLTDLNPFDEPQLEVNTALGKTVKQEKAQIKVESQSQEAETISNDVTQTAQEIRNITQNVPVEFMLLFALLAGWAIPDPKKCVEGLIVAPIRGTGEWILKLLGRS